MPLTHVRNARFHHRKECGVHRPVTWLYDKEVIDGNPAKPVVYFVYDFIGEDCDCGHERAVPVWPFLFGAISAAFLIMVVML